MERSKNTESTTTKPTADAGCRINIEIESHGDVNIYNCTTPQPSPERRTRPTVASRSTSLRWTRVPYSTANDASTSAKTRIAVTRSHCATTGWRRKRVE